MKIKRLAFFLVILLTAVSLAACGNAPALTIQGERLTFLEADAQSEYAGIAPAEGNRILAVRFLAAGENPDLSAITEGFFGENPSSLTSGSNAYPCRSIVFENDSGRIIAAVVFEVPASLLEGASCTLSGDGFSAIQFSI